MKNSSRLVGVLALQGDYFAHGRVLEKLGRDFIYVKTPEELAQVGSLILPGGESLTMRKIAKENGLWEGLKSFDGPILGTCAGIILLAEKITNPPEEGLAKLRLTIARNAYGSQINSFTETGKYLPEKRDIDLVFIRAPQISEIGKDVEIIVEYKGNPVGVKQGNIIGLTFHPELTSDSSIHKMFLGLGD